MNPHSAKTKFIKLGVLIMAAVTLAGTAGCSQRVPDVSGQVEQKLEAKYHEKFSVSKVYGGSLVPTNVFADTYKLICSPKNNPNLKFKAELSPNGVFYDGYVSAKVNIKVEKLLSDALHNEFPNVAVKSVAVNPYSDSVNQNTSLQEYINMEKGDFLIYTLIQAEKTKAKDIYNILQSTMKSVNSFSAATYCFCVDYEDFESGKKVFENNMDIEPKDFEKQYKSIEDASFKFENNSTGITPDIFANEFDKKGKWD